MMQSQVQPDWVKQPSAQLGSGNRKVRPLTALMAVLIIAGCTSSTSQPIVETPRFDSAQQDQITAMRDYRECADDVVETDRQARASRSTALYLASARLAQRCDQEIAPYAPVLADEERMKTYALGTLNAFKGGDAARAHSMIDTFKTNFPGEDLRFADGSSFIEAIDVLLAGSERPRLNRFSPQNVSFSLKQELRRVDNWSAR